MDGLAWIQEPDESVNGQLIEGRLRLFSVGYSNSVTEWDLGSGLPCRDASGGGSAVWCLSPQPQLSKAISQMEEEHQDQGTLFRGQNLVAGCADGSLILFSTADSDLRFQRYITRAPTKKAQALCITFQDRHKIIAGYANSFMRVYDVRTGTLIRNITLGAGLPGGPKETLVWQVKCLPSGDIVSGNSNGELQVWDGKTYSQRQRIAGHQSDILALALSVDGKTIFSGGTDMQTIAYKQDSQNRWARVYNEKIHKHEIKALAAFQDRRIDVLASGGVDTTPIVMPIRQFGNEYCRNLSRLPQQSPVVSAPCQRLLAAWWNRDVFLWRIGRNRSREKPAKNWKLISHLMMSSEENISSVSLSADGKLLAVSTAAAIKLFHLRTTAKDKHAIRIRKIEIPSALNRGARLLQLSPDNKWLAIVGNTSNVIIGRITFNDVENDEEAMLMPEIIALQRTSKPHQIQDGLSGIWGSYNRAITRLVFSGDSRVLVASDLAGSLDSWVLRDHEDSTSASLDQAIPNGTSHSVSSPDSSRNDSDDEDVSTVIIHGQHWVCNHNNHLLPMLDSAPLILSFRPRIQPQRALNNGGSRESPVAQTFESCSNREPDGDYRLLIVTAKHQIYEFDVLKGQLTDWSRRNPTTNFPGRWRIIHDKAIGCVWDVSCSPHKDSLWMYGNSWLVMLDLNQDLPTPKDSGVINDESEALTVTGNNKSKGKKRKRHERILHERKQMSGAGGKVIDQDRENVGIGQGIRTVLGSGKDAVGEVQSNGPEERNVEEQGRDESMDEDDDVELPSMRNPKHIGTVTNGALAETEEDVVRDKHRPPWWITFQYRYILGMVPIGGKDDDQQPEVALVERPLWDLDLPPRFTGPHDRG